MVVAMLLGATLGALAVGGFFANASNADDPEDDDWIPRPVVPVLAEANAWVAYAESVRDSIQDGDAPSPPPLSTDAIAETLDVTEDEAQAFVEAVGQDVATMIALVYDAMDSDMTWDAFASFVASLVPPMQMAAASSPVPIEDFSDLDTWGADGELYKGMKGGGPGRIFIGGTNDNDYTGAPADGMFGSNGGLFIDLGGDDQYAAGNRAFGSNGVFIDLDGFDIYEAGSNSFGSYLSADPDAVGPGPLPNSPQPAPSPALFVDAVGDDSYIFGDGSFGVGGTVTDTQTGIVEVGATGNLGRGVFVEGGGMDVYTPNAGASAGGFGRGGGVFLELAGSDQYQFSAASFAVQGASGTGGFVVELDGDDSYSPSPIGVGAPAGFGTSTAGFIGQIVFLLTQPGARSLFVDAAGNDDYAAGPISFGARASAFVDISGNDRYADITGSAFGFQEGTFVDWEGNDDYESGRSSFGAGGLFFDRRGEDNYLGGAQSFGAAGNAALVWATGVSQTGVFVDADGSDEYAAETRSFGAGGTFIDRRGNDQYVAGGQSFGIRGGGPTLTASVGGRNGAFLELGGSDVYLATSPLETRMFGTGQGLFLDAGGDDQYPALSLETSYGVPGLSTGEVTGAFLEILGTASQNSRIRFNGVENPLPSRSIQFRDDAGRESLPDQATRLVIDNDGAESPNEADDLVIVFQDQSGNSAELDSGDLRRILLYPEGTNGQATGVPPTLSDPTAGNICIAGLFPDFTATCDNTAVRLRSPADGTNLATLRRNDAGTPLGPTDDSLEVTLLDQPPLTVPPNADFACVQAAFTSSDPTCDGHFLKILSPVDGTNLLTVDRDDAATPNPSDDRFTVTVLNQQPIQVPPDVDDPTDGHVCVAGLFPNPSATCGGHVAEVMNPADDSLVARITRNDGDTPDPGDDHLTVTVLDLQPLTLPPPVEDPSDGRVCIMGAFPNAVATCGGNLIRIKNPADESNLLSIRRDEKGTPSPEDDAVTVEVLNLGPLTVPPEPSDPTDGHVCVRQVFPTLDADCGGSVLRVTDPDDDANLLTVDHNDGPSPSPGDDTLVITVLGEAPVTLPPSTDDPSDGNTCIAGVFPDAAATCDGHAVRLLNPDDATNLATLDHNKGDPNDPLDDTFSLTLFALQPVALPPDAGDPTGGHLCLRNLWPNPSAACNGHAATVTNPVDDAHVATLDHAGGDPSDPADDEFLLTLLDQPPILLPPSVDSICLQNVFPPADPSCAGHLIEIRNPNDGSNLLAIDHVEGASPLPDDDEFLVHVLDQPPLILPPSTDIGTHASSASVACPPRFLAPVCAVAVGLSTKPYEVRVTNTGDPPSRLVAVEVVVPAGFQIDPNQETAPPGWKRLPTDLEGSPRTVRFVAEPGTEPGLASGRFEAFRLDAANPAIGGDYAWTVSTAHARGDPTAGVLVAAAPETPQALTSRVDATSPTVANLVATPAAANGGSVEVSFLVNEPLDADPAVTVNGNPATFSSTFGMSYVFSYAITGADPEGTATIQITGADQAGNALLHDDASALVVDRTATLTSLLTTPAAAEPSGWFRSVVTVGFACNDGALPPARSGCVETRYRVGDGPLLAFSETGTFETGDGITTVRFYSVDAAGNVEAERTLDVRQDRSGPATALSTIPGAPSASGWFTGPVDVTLTCADGSAPPARSGCTTSHYRFDEGILQDYGSAFAPPQGETQIEYFSRDVAGNEETPRPSVTLRLDDEPPQGEILGISEDQAPVGDMPDEELVDLPGGRGFQLDYEVHDATSGLGQVLLEVQTPLDDEGSYRTYGTPLTGPEGTIDFIPAAEGLYRFRLRLTDVAGNAAISDVHDVTVHPAGATQSRIVTTALTSSDPFNRVGQSVVLTVHTTDATLAAFEAPLANVEVEIREGGTVLATVLTNGNGDASFGVSGPAAATRTFAALATAYHTLDGAESVTSSPATATVKWTRLLAAAIDRDPADASAAARGEPLSFRMTLTWHDGTPATGLLTLGNTVGFTFTGTGAGAADPLVHPSSSFNAMGAQDLGGGAYRVTYAYPHVQSFTVTTGGSAPGYSTGVGDPATSFTVPASIGLQAHWIAAVAGPVTFASLGRPNDATPSFVDRDDPVRVTVPVAYTANYDAAGDGTSERDPAPGATVALFRTSHLVGGAPVADPVEGLEDAFAVVTDGSNDDEDPRPGFVAVDVNEALLGAGANTYGLLAFPSSLTAGAGFEQDASDPAARSDFGASAALTFTAVSVAYLPDSLSGTSDPMSPEAVDETGPAFPRWWAAADSDDNPGTTDPVAFQVEAAFLHDGASVGPNAILGAFRADGTPLGGNLPLTATTDATGVATFIIQPDDYGLDYAPHTLTFRVVEAPEPSPLGDDIRAAAGIFVQEILWTKIHLHLVAQGGDTELNVGDATGVTVRAYWYHDEDEDASFFAAGAGALDAGDEARGPEGLAFTLSETTPGNTPTRIETSGALAADAFEAAFPVARGCTALDDPATPGNECTASRHVDHAAWHTFVADASGTPHGIPADDPDRRHPLPVLWTMVVLDLTTNRLTAMEDAPIIGTIRPYFAHHVDADGQALSLASRQFDRAVRADLIVSGSPEPYADEVLIGAGGSANVALTSAVPARLQIQAVSDHTTLGASDVIDPNNPHPLYEVARSAVVERAWLGLRLEGAWVESAVDYDGDGLLGGAIFARDLTTLRGTDIEVRLRLSLDDGDGPVSLTDAFPGYAFVAEDEHAVASMPDRSTATAPKPVAGQNALGLVGDETTPGNVPTSLDQADFAFEASPGCDCWIATIPGADHTAVEQVLMTLDAQLQVTDDSGQDVGTMVAAPSATFRETYTAIHLTFAGGSTSDGRGHVPTSSTDAVWANDDASVLYTLRALWAHDADGDGHSFMQGITDHGDAVEGATIVAAGTALVATDAMNGIYSLTLASAEAAELTFTFIATGAPDPTTGDPSQAFVGATDPATNRLTLAPVEQDFVFTRILLNYLAAPPAYANVGENVAVDFEATWAHAPGQPIERDVDGPTFWDFPSPLNQRTQTDDDGQGRVLLVASQVAQVQVTPSLVTNVRTPNGITRSTVPNAPTVTWTRLLPLLEPLQATASPMAGTYFNPENPATPDPDVFPTETLVTQPATLAFAHDPEIRAIGAAMEIGGAPRLTDASGTASATFTSTAAGWFKIEAAGLSADLAGATITSSLDASNWIGFDSGASNDGVNPA